MSFNPQAFGDGFDGGVSTPPGVGELSPASIAAIVAALVPAVLAALNATTIPVDARKMNGADIRGTGTDGDLWRGV